VVKRSVGILLLSLLIFIYNLALCRPVLASDLSDNFVKIVDKGILRIKTYDWKGTLLQEGKGYFSNPDGNITTVVPVVEGGYFVEAISYDGSEYIIEQINPLSQSSGLVFTRLEENPSDLTSIEEVAPFPAQEDEVWILETDQAGSRKLLKAVILETRKVPGMSKYLFVRASLPLGGVGSPVINEKGEVAGMVLLLAENRDDAGIIVSTDRIRSSYGVSGEIVSLLTWTEGRTTPWLEEDTGLYLRGLSSYHVGYYGSAVQYLERVAGPQGSGTKKASLALGDCYRDVGKTLKAIHAYEKGLNRARKFTDAHFSLVRLYLKQKRISDARNIWEEVARYDQKSSNQIIMTAWLLDAGGDTDQALVVAKKATEVDPSNARAHGTLGEIFCKQGNFDKAFMALERAALLQAGRNEFAADLCYAAVYSGRHEKAITVCEQAARSYSDKALSMMCLGDAYAAAGLNVQAIESYRSALRVDPENSRVRCRIGDLLTDTGSYKEAVAVFTDALSLSPDSAWLHFKLGKVSGIRGDRRAAAREVQILKDLNPALAHQLSLLLMAETSIPSPW
jgi:tetratricopeptide (TPR) repeat protein